MKKLFKIILGVVISLLVILLLTALILPFVINPNDYKGLIAETVKKETGRDLNIEGQIDLTFFPWLGVSVQGVKLSNAKGFEAPFFIQAESADIKVKLLPLFSQEVEMDTLRLRGAKVYLSRLADGTNNWDDLTQHKKASPTVETEQTPSDPTEILKKIKLSGLIFENTTVVWDDKQNQQNIQLNRLNIHTGILALGHPIDLSIDFNFDINIEQQPIKGQFSMLTTADVNLAQQTVQLNALTLNLIAQGDVVPQGKQDLKLTVEKVKLGWQDIDVFVQDLQLRGLDMVANLDLDVQNFASDAPLFKAEFNIAEFNPIQVLKNLGQKAPPLPYKNALQTAHFKTKISNLNNKNEFTPYIVFHDTQFKVDEHLLDILNIHLDLKTQTINVNTMQLTAFDIVSKLKLKIHQFTQKPQVTGTLHIAQFNPSNILHKLGQTPPTLPYDNALQSAQFSTEFKQQGKTITLNKTQLKLDNNQLKIQQANLDIDKQQLTLPRLQLQALGLNVDMALTLDALFSNPRFHGSIQVHDFNLHTLMQKLNLAAIKTNNPEALKKLSFGTQISGGMDSLRLKDIKLVVDNTKLNGSASVKHFKKADIQFDLAVDTLNLDDYLPPSETTAPVTPAGEPATPKPLPYEILHQISVNGVLKVKHLNSNKLKIDNIELKVNSQNGELHLKQKAAMYQGEIKADIFVDARQTPAQLHVQKEVNNIQIGDLLMDLRGETPIKGALRLSGSLKSLDASTALSIQKTLDGILNIGFYDGALTGFNLAHHLRMAQALVKNQPTPKEELKGTDFSELIGQFQFKDGVLITKDLSMKSPLIRLKGTGNIDYLTQEMDYRLNVAVVNSKTGQGGKSLKELNSLTIPVTLKGALANPDIDVDVKALLTLEAERQLEKHKDKLQQKLEKKLEKELFKLFN